MADISKLREQLRNAERKIKVIAARIQLAEAVGPKRDPLANLRRPKKAAKKRAAKKAKRR